MSSDNKIEVQFGATTEGVEKGATVAATAVEKSLASMKSSFAGMESSVKQLHDHFTGAFSGMQAGMAKFNNAMFAMQNLLSGGAMFKAAIGETLAFTGEAVKLSKALGMSTQAASELNIALKLTGQSAEELTGMAFKLLRQINTNEVGIKSLGVAVRDAKGDFIPLMDTMKSAGEVLLQYKEGTDRDAAAMYLFGRGAQEAMGIIKLNAEVMARAKVIAEEYGLKVGPEGAANAREYKRAMAEVSIIHEAMNEKIGSVLLPILVKLSGWFSQVGPPAIEAFGSILKAVVTIFEAVSFVIQVQVIKVSQWGDNFVSVAKMIWGVWNGLVNMSFKESVAAWDQGGQEMTAHAMASASAIENAYTGTSERVKKLWSEDHGSKPGETKTPKGGTKHWVPPEKPGSGAEKSEMGEMKAKLIEQLEAKGQFFKDSTEYELKYWSDIKALGGLGVADKRSVNSEVFNLTKKRLIEERDSQVAAVDGERNLGREKVDMKRQEVETLKAMGTITDAEALRRIKEFNELEFSLDRDALTTKLNIMGIEQKERIKLMGEIAALEEKNKVRTLKDATAISIAVRKSWQDAFAPIGSAFDKATSGIIAGTTTIGAAIKNMAQSIAIEYAQMGLKMVMNWAVAEASKTTASAAGAAARGEIEAGAALKSVALTAWATIKNIMAYAWEAMAAAYKAVAGIYMIGPALAPIAAGVAFAGVAKMAGSVMSARGGYDIPAGVNPLTQLHEKEMVLPAKQADAVRDMATKGHGGGDVHLHVQAMDGQSVKRLFNDHAPALADVLRRQAGKFSFT